MSCEICDSTKNIDVWVVSDPYYGYGHFATLRCKGCGKPNDWRYDSHHEYKPYRDDYFLGTSKKKPLDLGFMMGKMDPYKCYDCNGDIPPSNGEGIYKFQSYSVPTELSKELGNEIYVCRECAIKRYNRNTHSRDWVEKELLQQITK